MNAQDSLKNRGDGSREKVPDILQSRVMTGKKAPEKFRKLPDSIESPPRPLRLPLTLLPVPLSSPPSSRSLPASFPSLLFFSVPHVARGPRPLRSPPAPPRRLPDASPPLSQTCLRRSRVGPTPSPPRTLLPLRASPPALPTRHSLFPSGGLHSSSRRFPAGQ